MAEKKIIKADHISIALSKHHRGDLIKLHKELFPPSKTKSKEAADYFKVRSKMDIVIEIAQSGKTKKIETLWDDRLFAANPTVSYHRFFEPNTKKKKPIANGIKRIKNRLQAFDDLLEKTYNPKLSEEPKLIKINRVGSKYLFMFGVLGRKKYVPVDYKYEVYQEPRFAYCVWDNDDALLQIRTSSDVGHYLGRFSEWLKNSPVPDIEGLKITKDNFDNFVGQITGTVRTAKGKNSDVASEYEAKELTSKKDIDVRATAKYNDEMGEYEVYSHGVDFEYDGDEHRLYIGFKSGTIYFKKGSVTEPLLDYIKESVAEVQ